MRLRRRIKLWKERGAWGMGEARNRSRTRVKADRIYIYIYIVGMNVIGISLIIFFDFFSPPLQFLARFFRLMEMEGEHSGQN